MSINFIMTCGVALLFLILLVSFVMFVIEQRRDYKLMQKHRDAAIGRITETLKKFNEKRDELRKTIALLDEQLKSPGLPISHIQQLEQAAASLKTLDKFLFEPANPVV